MAFRYRKAEAGNSTLPVNDFPLNAAYAATMKVGDVVRLNGSGEVVLAATGDTTVLGVLEGWNFEGLGITPKTAKVQRSANAIYEVDYTGGAPGNIGTEYGINGASQVDIADVTTKIVRVTDKKGTKLYVRFIPTALQV